MSVGLCDVISYQPVLEAAKVFSRQTDRTVDIGIFPRTEARAVKIVRLQSLKKEKNGDEHEEWLWEARGGLIS